jgi:hypothetical protein
MTSVATNPDQSLDVMKTTKIPVIVKASGRFIQVATIFKVEYPDKPSVWTVQNFDGYQEVGEQKPICNY